MAKSRARRMKRTRRTRRVRRGGFSLNPFKKSTQTAAPPPYVNMNMPTNMAAPMAPPMAAPMTMKNRMRNQSRKAMNLAARGAKGVGRAALGTVKGIGQVGMEIAKTPLTLAYTLGSLAQ